MQSVSFEDEDGDTVETWITSSGSYVSIDDGGGVVYISVKSIDKLILALQELKGEL